MPEQQPIKKPAIKRTSVHRRTYAGSFLTAFLIAGFSASCSVFSDPKQTDEYKCAIEIVRKSEEIRKLLGEPLDESAPAKGPVVDDPNDRSVVMIMPISGPKGSGKLSITAVRDKRNSDLLISFEQNDDVTAVYAGPYPCK